MNKAQKKNLKKSIGIIFTIFVTTFAYAFIRYNIFQGVPWSEIPYYILNKALAWTAIFSILLSYLPGTLKKFGKKVKPQYLAIRKHFGIGGFFIASLHIQISLVILRPDLFPYLHDGDKMNPNGDLAVMFGVLTFTALLMPAVVSIPSVIKAMPLERWKKIQYTGYIALLFNLFHLAAVGSMRWFNPGGWPGFLPPITLLAATMVIFLLMLRGTSLIAEKSRKKST